MNSRKLTTISSLLSSAAAAALLAGTVSFSGNAYASQTAAIGGAAISGVQVQNLSGSTATVQIELHPQAGGAPVTLSAPSVAAQSAANFYLPSATNVPTGAYGAVLSSDQQIAAIARTEWTSGGKSGAATYGSVPPAQNVILPLVVGNYAGQNSQFTVQNAGTTAATVTIQVRAVGSATAVKTATRTIQPGASATLIAGQGELSGLPNTQANPSGFLGNALITGNQPLVVQSFVDFTNSNRAVYAFSGVPVPTNTGQTTLYAPLLRRNYFGTTGMSLVNPTGTDATVTIRYFNDPQSPSKMGTANTETVTVKANSSAAPFQGTSKVLPAGTSLNKGWFGSARITSSQPLVAVVNDAVFVNGNFAAIDTSAAYNAGTAAEGATTIYAPLVRNAHTNSRLTTGIQVQNLGTASTTVTVTFKNNAGATVGRAQQSVQPGASVNFYQGNAPSAGGFPAGQFGSAVITSSGGQNIAAIVNDFSAPGATTPLDAAIFNGLK